MQRRMTVTASLLAIGSMLVAVPPAQSSGSRTRSAEITASDGTPLRATVCEPTTPGRHPAAVLVAAWGGGSTQNILPCQKLAARGYVAVSYGPRGFGESGGEVDVAGPQDVHDVSSVLDWTIGHTETDPARIGVGGVSYGAGISLLAASFDDRIRAVASMSGWGDLEKSLYGNHTRRAAVATVLRLSGEQNGHLSERTRSMLDKYAANSNVPEVSAWARERSPSNYLDRINRRRPAVLAVQAWNETVFPPDQMADYFSQLNTAKRLEVVPGDHASTETGELIGLPNKTWDSVYRWFDAHVAGTDTSITHEQPVVIEPRNRPDHPRESYPDWQHISTAAERYTMADDKLTPAARDSGKPTTISTGRDTVANGGIPLVTYSIEALTDHPPAAWLPAVDREHGAVWTGPKLTEGRALRGNPHLHATVTPATAEGTLVAYLYDRDPAGNGKLVSYAPYTWSGATPHAPMTVDTDLPATAYDVPEGHSLSVVIDTEDPMYFLDRNKPDAPLTIGPSSMSLALNTSPSEEAQ